MQFGNCHKEYAEFSSVGKFQIMDNWFDAPLADGQWFLQAMDFHRYKILHIDIENDYLTIDAADLAY